jgi:acetylornithine aminotransferase
VFFCNSGAEANEAALKVVRKYAKEKLATDRYEVHRHPQLVPRTDAGHRERHRPAEVQHGFEPLMPGFKHVPYNDLRAMERAMDSHTAAILVEPIQGEGGVYVPDDGYLAGPAQACDESAALLVFDEVQTGVGRTGRLWGYEHWGVEPDVMTLAKALANGIPIGAMLCREHVASALTAGTHGSTFAGSAFVTSVALATLTTIIGDKIPDRAAQRGREMTDALRALQAKLPVITQVRGKGCLIGIELSRPAGPVMDACRDAGLLVLTAGEKVLRLAPPLIVEPADCQRAIGIVADALKREPAA